MFKKVFCLFSIFLFCADFLPAIFAQDFVSGQKTLVAKADKKSGKKNKKSAPPESEVEEEIPESVTKIKIDKSKKGSSGYFSGIDGGVLGLVENGSPESLLKASQLLKKASVDYADNERVLVFVASQILKIVWPSQTSEIEEPEINFRNAYSGAIDSAKNGIYDTSTGKTDFLATVLPSLVLCSVVSRSDYYDQAEVDLLDALSVNPQSVLANYLLGVLYTKTENYEAAVTRFKIAGQYSASFEISFRLASCLNALGRFDESKAITDNLIVLYPSNINLLKLLAQNAYDRADYSSAERYAVLILTQNPADLEMVLFRAKVFVRTGEYLKASSLLDVYSKSNSSSKDYLLLRSRVQNEWNKNISAAISTIEKALSLYPNDTQVVLYAAELAGDSSRTVGGKTGAELSGMILAKDPENPQALSFLIQTLVASEKWNEAYASSKKLMAKNPSTETVRVHIGICLSLGYNDEAWANAVALYNKSPAEEKAIQSYVEAMIRTGRGSQASRFINTSINSSTSSMKSFLYYQRSFLAAAEAAQLSDLRSAIIANPRNSDALFRMYEIYFQKQDYRKAQYYLRQVIALNPNKSNYLKLNSDLDKLIK